MMARRIGERRRYLAVSSSECALPSRNIQALRVLDMRGETDGPTRCWSTSGQITCDGERRACLPRSATYAPAVRWPDSLCGSSLRLSLRFILPLIVALAIVAYAVIPLVDRLTLRWAERDLDARATLIANASDETLTQLVATDDTPRLKQFFGRLAQDEKLFAVAFCASPQSTPIATPTFSRLIGCASLDSTGSRMMTGRDGSSLYVSVRPVATDSLGMGRLILVHDLGFITRRSEQTRTYLFYFFVAQGIVISFITVLIAQLSWRGWISGLRALVRGEALGALLSGPDNGNLHPIAQDLRELIRDIEAEHRGREEEQHTWTAESIRDVLKQGLRGQQVIVVSNREPYIHVTQGKDIVVHQPASGLVTALEPIMRACAGTWIAHGSGSADRRVVDSHDRIAVPEANPAYTLRRVWLSEKEEAGYYYGFANQGLWPLCHIAHVRPTFRASDWEQYVKVNAKFARAVVAESKSSDPIVLVQDYHFALLPRMIRDELPEATIVTFWHIPWPNPEAFGICPWREELLDGMLGSSILGFHTQFHCNNFVDTVDRLLEARVDRETFGVSYRHELTSVKRYPISIEWPPSPALMALPVAECRDRVRREHGLPLDHAIGVGVDRLDYTKGIEERFRAVERFLEKRPEWVGRFTFIQVAAPTRATIEEYQGYDARVRALAERINSRFASAEHPPILLEVGHREPPQVYEYYRAAEVCVVSSLHDGMNLVAKEFVASRDDERGVLILSRFTGAARELPESLVVNPYDVDECASALYQALTMPESEQRARMRLMRGLVREFNVFRWAGRMLIDAAGMRRHGRLSRRARRFTDRAVIAGRGTMAE
jgi:trehalose 6-phosphate synthase